MKVTDREKQALLPKTLGAVLTCSTSIMSADAKLLLIALVYRWAKNVDERNQAIRVKDIAFALGEHHGTIAEAARELHKLDYVDKEKDTLKLIKGQDILRNVGSFFTVPGLKTDTLKEFAATGKVEAPKMVEPKEDDVDDSFHKAAKNKTAEENAAPAPAPASGDMAVGAAGGAYAASSGAKTEPSLPLDLGEDVPLPTSKKAKKKSKSSKRS